jgi:ribulose-5-phosphate 4-epimerase/fuculose-1-phosphate aldolase
MNKPATLKTNATASIKDQSIRVDLACAFRLFAMLGSDDLSYTHISARSSGSKEEYFINPFGVLFEEIRSLDLLRVHLNGDVLEKSKKHHNPTGHVIHRAIYGARPDVNCIIHLHTPAGIAVSIMKDGLLPLTQFSLLFYEKTGYHAYEGLAIKEQEGKKIAKDLAQNNVLFLRSHGTLVVGKTIHEAVFYMHYLEKACQTQVKLLSMGKETVALSHKKCQKARDQMLNFENDLGRRDWDALVRKLERLDKILIKE